MADPPLLERLRAADDALRRERLPPSGVRRIAKRLAEELDRRERQERWPWVPMLTFVAGATLVLAFLAWARAPRVDLTPRMDRAPAVVTREAEPDTPSMRIEAADPTDVKVDRRIVRMDHGTALFDIDPVRGDPVRVLTPAGEIRVVGTRFRVVVEGATVHVHLYEGKLEFHGNDGTVTPIEAGQQMTFGEPEPAIEIIEDKPPRRTLDAADVIDKVHRLRRARSYVEAARTLESALKHRWPRRTAEVLSYELGWIRSRHLADTDKACRHWRAHLRRFPSTRYRRQITTSIAALHCP